MKMISHARVTYQTIFQGDENDLQALLDFLSWLRADRSIEKILADQDYGATEFWRSLSSDLFVGFSSEKIVLCAGYIYPQSVTVPYMRPTLKKLAEKLFGKEDFQKTFAKCHPLPANLNASILKNSTYEYMRVLENLLMAGANKPVANYLEVCAGNAVSIAHMRHISKDTRFTVVDLPEMICAAYLYLRLIHPDMTISLPHQRRNGADIQFLLPYQAAEVPQRTFDLAINTASFQEMKPEVVNNYIALFQRSLKSGGRISLVNQENSRYIKGNGYSAYDLTGFSDVVVSDAPFGNRTSAHALGLNIKHVTGIRQ